MVYSWEGLRLTFLPIYPRLQYQDFHALDASLGYLLSAYRVPGWEYDGEKYTHTSAHLSYSPMWYTHVYSNNLILNQLYDEKVSCAMYD